MITNNDLMIEKLTVGVNTYPMFRLHLNQMDALDGFVLSVFAGSLLGATTTVNVVAMHTGEEDIAAEIAGNTYYNVTAGAAAKKLLGTLTFDFQTYLENTIQIQPNVASGGLTFPKVMPVQLAFVFASEALVIKKARMSRRNHPAAI